MYDLLRQRANSLSQSATDLTIELIRTSSPSLHEQSVSATVERAMRQAGLDRVVRDDYGNVAGVLFGLEPGPTVLLLSHMDTVQARPEDRWSHDPLSGRCDDGRIVGLGAADCKGGIAAQLFAAVALKRSILPLRGNVVVAATVAEENGAALGLRALLASTLPDLGLVPEFAILGEPTNLGICYGHEGWAELSVRLLGRDLFQVADAGRGFYQDLVERKAAGRLQNGKQNLLVKEPSFTNERGKPAATLLLTRRLLHGQHLADLMAQTEYGAASAVKEAGTVSVEVDLMQEHQQLGTGQTRSVPRLTSPWLTDPHSPLVERARHALLAGDCMVRTGEWTLERLGMGTAGGALLNDFSIPTIGYGPGNEKAAHAVDEHVTIQDLTQAIYGTACIAHALVGVPVYGWISDEI